jgi:hypothetical protein
MIVRKHFYAAVANETENSLNVNFSIKVFWAENGFESGQNGVENHFQISDGP